MSQPPITVGLCEDHTLVRQGLSLILQGEPHVEKVLEAGTPRDLLAGLKTVQPQVLLMDIALPQMSGPELTRQVLQAYPSIRVLFLSSNTSSDHVRLALRAGGRGFVSKAAPAEVLLRGIEAVANGLRFFDPELSQQVFEDFSEYTQSEAEPTRLTDRELQMLRLLAAGLTQREIGEQASISVKTVEKHRRAIYDKLGLQSHTELIKYALREGLISL